MFNVVMMRRNNGLYYLSLRLWIGVWTAIILLILVAIDASAFVCYITRFTEENFATLISVIFIYKAIEKVLEINRDSPIDTRSPDDDTLPPLDYTCYCSYSTSTSSAILEDDDPSMTTVLLQSGETPNRTALTWCKRTVHGKLVGDGCSTPTYVPDVFLFSVIMFATTYVISVMLKDMKTSSYFPTKVRTFLSDFAVVIAIFSMTAIDNWVGLATPKLLVPHDFKVSEH